MMRLLIVLAALALAGPVWADEIPCWTQEACVARVKEHPDKYGDGIISGWTPKCPDGYELLANPVTFRPICARDLQEPK